MAVVNGTAGNDSLTGTASADSISGFAGNDTLNGLGAVDTLNGGLGNDTYIVTAGDVLADSGGIDTVVTDVNWTLGADFENLTMTGAAALSVTGHNGNNFAIGNSGNNYFNARAGNDTIQAGAGNDWIDMSAFGTASYGDDVIDGGAGTDTVNFAISAGQQSAITVDLGAGTIRGGGQGGAGSATVANVETVIGAAFNDSFKGSIASETFEGREGNDTLSGMGGNDTLTGGTGQDTFLFAAAPGTGNLDLVADFVSATDKLTFDNAVFTAIGASGNFVAGDPRFAAGAGFNSGRDTSDRVIYNTSTGQLFYDADGNGAGAAQLIATLQGNPTLAATDIAVQGGGGGGMLITGGSGPDSLVGGPGNDTIRGGDGQDTLEGLGGNDLLEGGAFDDTLLGGDGDDTLIGGTRGTFTAIDRLDGGNGNDRLEGGTMLNLLLGGDGADHLIGNADFDTLDGGAGVDTLEGGRSPDRYIVTAGDVVIETADDAAADTVESDGSWTLTANVEILELKGTGSWSGFGNAQGNALVGNDAPNFLNPGTGGDHVLGMGGNDTIDLPAGDSSSSDFVDGGDGIDLLNFAGYLQSGIVVDLNAGTATGGGAGGAGNASVVNVENVVADAFGDQLFGDAAANLLDGRGGDDTLGGSRGNDTLLGGAGRDIFAFATAPSGANADRVADFVSGTDKLQLDGATHVNLGADGNFALGDARFAAGAGFTSGRDSSDRVVYDTTTGNLYYDADGSGADAAQLIATLQGAPTLLATDIVARGGPTTGTDGDDSITGTDGDDFIDGRGGNDTVEARFGDDTVLGGAGNDSLTGGVGADSMLGGDGDDTLDGASGQDHWSTGFGGAEPTSGLPGDTLDGGLGNDVYIIQENDVVVDAGGIDTIHMQLSDYTLAGGIENLKFTPFGFRDGEGESIRLSGNELDNVITSFGAGPFHGSSDTLDGGAGNDALFGARGNTTFRFSLASGDYGRDHLDGGGGITNTLDFSDARSAIVADLQAGTVTGGGAGGSGSATLVNINAVIGGAFDDRIIASPSGSFDLSASLRGGGGNDTVEGVADADSVLVGDEGNDRLVARAAGDHLEGGAGEDSFVFARSPGDDPRAFAATRVLDFASGADKIVLDGVFQAGAGASGNFAAGDERFHAAAGATSGHDTSDRVIFNTSTRELFYDADGSGPAQAQLLTILQTGATLVATDITVENGVPAGQTINGTAGNDSLVGTGSDDSINGLAGNDTLRGSGGNDVLDGGTGVDSLDGGLGNDTYIVTAGDVLSDAGGIDGLITDINWTLGADFENLAMTGTAGLSVTGHNGNNLAVGNSGNNYFNLRAGNDTIQAGAGNDWIDMSAFGTASYGDDVIDGGEGFDTVNFAIAAGQASAITVDVDSGTIRGGGQAGAGSASITGVERVIGTGFGDSFLGDSGANTFEGREGNDTLRGMFGNDTLTGGTGQDIFTYAESAGVAQADLITDFVSATDKVAMHGGIFTGLGAQGNFVPGDARFAAGAGFTSGRDASDRMVYNTSTGQLFYDADGSGAGAAQLVATLQGNPAITATDITVI